MGVGMKRHIFSFLMLLAAAFLAADAEEQVILLTGFSPFGTYERNVSIESILPLEGRTVRGYTISVLELPVAWEQSAAMLRSAIADLRPRMVIASGIDPSLEGMLIIETEARNRTTFTADELGNLPPGDGIIITDGEPRLSTTIPASEVLDRMEAHRIPAVQGADAGSYVCNWVFYHLMDELPEYALGGFIHIAPDMDPEIMQSIWMVLLREILDVVSGYRENYCFTITQ